MIFYTTFLVKILILTCHIHCNKHKKNVFPLLGTNTKTSFSTLNFSRSGAWSGQKKGFQHWICPISQDLGLEEEQKKDFQHWLFHDLGLEVDKKKLFNIEFLKFLKIYASKRSEKKNFSILNFGFVSKLQKSHRQRLMVGYSAAGVCRKGRLKT